MALETSSLHSLVHETTTISTTSVLDLRRDMLPISQEDYLVHEVTNFRLLGTRSLDGTWSLFPKRNSLSMRRQIIDKFGTRSSDGTSYLSPKKIFSSIKTTTNSATSILNLRTGQVPNLPRGLSHIRDNNQSTTTVFDPNRDKISNSQEELFIHEITTRRLPWHSTSRRYKNSNS